MASTGATYPTAYSAATATNPQNMYGAGTVNSIGKMYAKYNTFGFSIPSGATIDGIEVQYRAYGDFGSHKAKSTLYYNGRATAAPTTYTTATFGGSYSIKTVGGPTTTWGRTWADTDFSDANFAIRYDADAAADFGYTDWMTVNVYYTVAATTPGIWVNVAGADKRGAAVYVNVGGVAKLMNNMYVNVSGAAKAIVFS